jgi:hypothetical protein
MLPHTHVRVRNPQCLVYLRNDERLSPYMPCAILVHITRVMFVVTYFSPAISFRADVPFVHPCEDVKPIRHCLVEDAPQLKHPVEYDCQPQGFLQSNLGATYWPVTPRILQIPPLSNPSRRLRRAVSRINALGSATSEPCPIPRGIAYKAETVHRIFLISKSNKTYVYVFYACRWLGMLSFKRREHASRIWG